MNRLFYNLFFVAFLITFTNCGDDNTVAPTPPETGVRVEVSNVNFTTSDNIEINASLGQLNNLTAPAPAVILIHQANSDKREWRNSGFFNTIVEEGFYALAISLRLHGESGSDGGTIPELFGDPERAPKDILAAIDYIQTNLNASAIHIIGNSVGGNLANVACGCPEYAVASCISISPRTDAVEGLAGKELDLKNILYISSDGDQGGAREGWANELFERTEGDKGILILEGSAGHGIEIVNASEEIRAEMLKWLQ